MGISLRLDEGWQGECYLFSVWHFPVVHLWLVMPSQEKDFKPSYITWNFLEIIREVSREKNLPLFFWEGVVFLLCFFHLGWGTEYLPQTISTKQGIGFFFFSSDVVIGVE